MNNYYEVQKNIDKIFNNHHTNFLDGKMQKLLKQKLPKNSYKIYYPYKDSEKVIYYTKEAPKIVLIKIITKESLRHQDILGTVFSLGISNETFGDIIIDGDNYYIYVMENLKEYFKANLTMVKNIYVTLKEIDLSVLEHYQRKYEEHYLTVTSERIDTIISHIIHTNRIDIKNKIKNKEIILNYDYLTNASKNLKKDDIFSIKKHGKYKYDGIIKVTKKGNKLIRYYKYI